MRRVTSIQIVLDIVHTDEIAPADLAQLVAQEIESALTWPDNEALKRASPDVEQPVMIASATVLATVERT